MSSELSKHSITGYTDLEKRFIQQEFIALANARQDTYSNDTLREWVKTFFEKGYTANQVCKRIRAVKEDVKLFKVTFVDFINAEIDDIPDIVQQQANKELYLYAILICSVCGKSTTIQKKDLYTVKQLSICEHKHLDEMTLKGISPQLKSNYQEFNY
jgi:hypothetical protein